MENGRSSTAGAVPADPHIYNRSELHTLRGGGAQLKRMASRRADAGEQSTNRTPTTEPRVAKGSQGREGGVTVLSAGSRPSTKTGALASRTQKMAGTPAGEKEAGAVPLPVRRKFLRELAHLQEKGKKDLARLQKSKSEPRDRKRGQEEIEEELDSKAVKKFVSDYYPLFPNDPHKKPIEQAVREDDLSRCYGVPDSGAPDTDGLFEHVDGLLEANDVWGTALSLCEIAFGCKPEFEDDDVISECQPAGWSAAAARHSGWKDLQELMIKHVFVPFASRISASDLCTKIEELRIGRPELTAAA